MKTAIVYYSLEGNTKYTADKIADILKASCEVDIIRIEPKKAYPDKGFKKFFWGGKSAVMAEMPTLQPYEFDATKYDRIIFGTPVWASTFTPPIRTFINENPAVKEKQIAVFTCFSGGGADKALAKLQKFLEASKFEAELILVDPKDNVKEEDDSLIAEFCEKLK
ncbi:MAG: NAD(P)H-dependent oxidoreductase [Lachnospiraceae bacterium]|nr:NAD(P)H-dependent oxidoreductase [Lachnospiraceae bacterium]